MRAQPRALWMLVIVGLALPASSRAGEPGRPPNTATGLTLRLGGSTEVNAEQSVDTLVVIGGDADVRGTVTDTLVVVGGRAQIDGNVLGGVSVVSGKVVLGPEAHVHGNLTLIGSEYEPASGARVDGSLRQSEGGWPSAGFRLTLWAAMSLASYLVALLCLALAREPLDRSRATLVSDLAGTLGTTLALLLGAPALAMLGMLTMIGVPAAFGLLLFVLPALWFLGYVTAAFALGAASAGALGGHPRHPAAVLALGVVLVQGLALTPVIGGALLLAAGQVGAGAFVRQAWQRRQQTLSVRARAGRPAALAS